MNKQLLYFFILLAIAAGCRNEEKIKPNSPPEAVNIKVELSEEGTEATLTWNKAKDADGDEVKYSLSYVDKLISNIIDTTFTIKSLPINTEIEVKVISIDNRGAKSTATVSFKTGTGVAVVKSIMTLKNIDVIDIFEDNFGNFYITGSFTGNVNIGSFSVSSRARTDYFFAKLNPNKEVIMLKTGGGSDDDTGSAISVDDNGNIIVAGSFYSDIANFESTNGIETTVKRTFSNQNAFIIKYDPQGNVLWARKAGGNGNLETKISRIATFGTDIFLVGHFYRTVIFETSPGLTPTVIPDRNLDFQIVLVKYDRNGVLRAIREAGGIAQDIGYGIAIDRTRQAVYITGKFLLTSTFTTGNSIVENTLKTNIGQSFSDIFIAKYNLDGDLLWLKREGGTGDDRGNDIQVDNNGFIYLTGYLSTNANFNNPSGGSNTILTTGAKGCFVAKYDPEGRIIWVKTGGSFDENLSTEGLSVKSDGSNVYVVGIFSGTANFGDPIINGVNEINAVGQRNFFIAKYDNIGNLKWLRSGGSKQRDYVYRIIYTKKQDLVTVGYFDGPGKVEGKVFPEKASFLLTLIP